MKNTEDKSKVFFGGWTFRPVSHYLQTELHTKSLSDPQRLILLGFWRVLVPYTPRHYQMSGFIDPQPQKQKS